MALFCDLVNHYFACGIAFSSIHNFVAARIVRRDKHCVCLGLFQAEGRHAWPESVSLDPQGKKKSKNLLAV